MTAPYGVHSTSRDRGRTPDTAVQGIAVLVAGGDGFIWHWPTGTFRQGHVFYAARPVSEQALQRGPIEI